MSAGKNGINATNCTNGTHCTSSDEYQISAFTTISEVFAVTTALIAIVLNVCFIICVWKVSTFTTGFRIFFMNFGAAACICALGSLIIQLTNVTIRIFSIKSVIELYCSSCRVVFSVPASVLNYHLVAIGVERLIILIRLKRHQKVEISGWYYCGNSKISTTTVINGIPTCL